MEFLFILSVLVMSAIVFVEKIEKYFLPPRFSFVYIVFLGPSFRFDTFIKKKCFLLSAYSRQAIVQAAEQQIGKFRLDKKRVTCIEGKYFVVLGSRIHLLSRGQ